MAGVDARAHVWWPQASSISTRSLNQTRSIWSACLYILSSYILVLAVSHKAHMHYNYHCKLMSKWQSVIRYAPSAKRSTPTTSPLPSYYLQAYSQYGIIARSNLHWLLQSLMRKHYFRFLI